MNREQIIETMAKALCEAQQPSGAWDRNTSEGYHNIFRNEATAALSALEAAGLVVVPVEPTEAMLAAFQQGMSKEFGWTTTAGYHSRIYTAMIKAAQEGRPNG